MKRRHGIMSGTWGWGRITSVFCIVSCLVFSEGCGSAPSVPVTDSVGDGSGSMSGSSQDEATPTPSETGPCDRDHRDRAIALAKSAARHRLGQVGLVNPTAEFETIYLTSQLPGQPEPPRSTGWMITFEIHRFQDDSIDITAPARTGPPPPPAQPPVPGETPSATLAATDSGAQSSPESALAGGQFSAPGVADQPHAPTEIGPHSQSAPQTGSVGIGTADTHVTEFVHFDGSITDL